MSQPIPLTRRGHGRQLLTDTADLFRRKAQLLEERAEIDLRLAVLERDIATKLGQIGTSEVELSTARKAREPLRPPVRPVDDLTKRAARAIRKVMP